MRRFLQVIIGLVIGGVALGAFAEREDWAVKDALVKINVTLGARPSHPDAGMVLEIPGGGILPKTPYFNIKDEAGNDLDFQYVWYNPAESIGLVFRAPPENQREVTVYVKLGAKLQDLPKASTFKPSIIMTARSAPQPSLDLAKKMKSEWPPAQGAYGEQVSRLGKAAFVWFGMDENFVTWHTGWINLPAKEIIYFATLSSDGSEVHIDNNLLVDWPGLHDRWRGSHGEFGKTITLEAGWHRVDYFHFAGPRSRAAMPEPKETTLTWRRQSSTNNVPVFMEDNAWARSGTTRIRRIELASRAVATWVLGHNNAVTYLWLGDKPIHLHELAPDNVRRSDNYQFKWDMGKGMTSTNETLYWLVPGGENAPVPTASLTTISAGGTTTQTFSIRSFMTPMPSSMESSPTRLLFRQAFFDMLTAAPKDQDPCADWNSDMWLTLTSVMDSYKGGPILLELFDRAYKTIQTLSKDQRCLLEDRFMETLRLMRDTDKQLEWIDAFEKNAASDRERAAYWKEERINCYLYDAGDVELARQAATAMREWAGPNDNQRALLKLGDVERIAGDREKALKYYEESEAKYRAKHGLPNFNVARGRATAWRIYAVNDAAQAATIRNYIADNYIVEAFAALKKWENEIPLSKYNGAYCLTEALVYQAADDYRRVAAITAAYLQGDALTSQYPEAASMAMEAMLRLRMIPEAKALAEECLKRFQGLPVATHAEIILERIGKMKTEDK